MRKTDLSVVRERRLGERRVLLAPREVQLLVESGTSVSVEAGAGEGVGFSDAAYREAGAQIVDTDSAWQAASLVAKVKPPLRSEFRYLREGAHIGAIFHAEGDPELLQALIDRRVTAYSYEFFKTAEGSFPMAIPGGEIAGAMAVLHAAYYLQSHIGGAGVLLPRVSGGRAAKVVIIGHGNVGGAAARLADRMGADVVVFGRNPAGLRRFSATVPSARCLLNTPETLRSELLDADVVIGAILISTFDTPPIIDDPLVRSMKPGSVIVDATAGYGAGYLSTFDRSTEPAEPTFIRNGVVHCKLDALPSLVPVTSVEAYSANAWQLLARVSRKAKFPATEDPLVESGVIVADGHIIHQEVGRHFEHWLRRRDHELPNRHQS